MATREVPDREVADKVAAHISKHWRGCPACGFSRWDMIGYVTIPSGPYLVGDGANPMVAVNGAPAIAMSCERCGYVVQITRKALGV